MRRKSIFKKIFYSLFALVLSASLFTGCGGDSGSGGGDGTTYTVTYDSNGATGGTVPVDSTEYETGQTVTVLDNTGSLVLDGSALTGWNTAADGSGTTYTVGQTFTMGSTNVTLYAIWASSANSITGFTFEGSGAAGTINESDHTITVTLLNAKEDASALTPAITLTGTGISPASGTVQDFTGPVTFTVTAEDGSEQDYTVTVKISFLFGAYDDTNGYELWVSDGTEAGTSLLKDINPGTGDSDPIYFTVMNNKVYFQAYDATDGYELWVSDGTETGTFMLKDINPGTGDGDPYNFTVMNNQLYFRASNGTNGTELWVSDGTEAGTFMLKDINSGTGNGNPYYLTVMNNKLYFRASDGTNGYELWVCDGTEAGTTMPKDIYSGTGSSYPFSFSVYNNTLYFPANNGTNGYELWVSDGTEAGTSLFKDINPGSGNSFPYFTPN